MPPHIGDITPDFTPVCTTEMVRTAQRAAEFAKRNTKSIGLSPDPAKTSRLTIIDTMSVRRNFDEICARLVRDN